MAAKVEFAEPQHHTDWVSAARKAAARLIEPEKSPGSRGQPIEPAGMTLRVRDDCGLSQLSSFPHRDRSFIT